MRVDHQHAIGQRLDHQLVDLRLHARRPLACARRLFLARQPGRQLVGQEGQREIAGAGQPGLQEARRRVAGCSQRSTQASVSSSKVTPAAVPSASSADPSTEPISTGSANSGE